MKISTRCLIYLYMCYSAARRESTSDQHPTMPPLITLRLRAPMSSSRGQQVATLCTTVVVRYLAAPLAVLVLQWITYMSVANEVHILSRVHVRQGSQTTQGLTSCCTGTLATNCDEFRMPRAFDTYPSKCSNCLRTAVVSPTGTRDPRIQFRVVCAVRSSSSLQPQCIYKLPRPPRAPTHTNTVPRACMVAPTHTHAREHLTACHTISYMDT